MEMRHHLSDCSIVVDSPTDYVLNAAAGPATAPPKRRGYATWKKALPKASADHEPWSTTDSKSGSRRAGAAAGSFILVGLLPIAGVSVLAETGCRETGRRRQPSDWLRGTANGRHESGGTRVRLTNDCYLITLHAGAGVEHYFRDGPIWIKRSTRGRRFEATAEQVLNHLLPALAGVKPGVIATVEHRDTSEPTALTLDGLRERSAKNRRWPDRVGLADRA